MHIFFHSVLAFVLRVGLMYYGKYQDQNFAVKYTDIDYSVYTDAARYLYNGSSPYERHTYRYSPVLAFMLSPNIFFDESFGKLLFAFLDVLTGYLIYAILRNYNVGKQQCETCCSLWLYNPICAVISTRGSSDSIMTVLVLMCIRFLQGKRIYLLGFAYGLAVHCRLYPCIYALSFYAALSDFPDKKMSMLSKFYVLFCPNVLKLKLVTSACFGFGIPTVVSHYFYGQRFIEEAFLYHLARKDIKHNFSPYFYFMYLMADRSDSFQDILTYLPFVTQLVLLLFATWTFYLPQAVPSALFIQTFTFVTFNKVCTSQYFLWYLSLLPLNIPLLRLRLGSLLKALVLWVLGQFLWLIPAYYLEFMGGNVFLLLWGCSLAMFLINVYLLQYFCTIVPLCGFNLTKSPKLRKLSKINPKKSHKVNGKKFNKSSSKKSN